MLKKEVRKPFPIEANITEFNSISDLPGEFLTLLAHDTKIILTSDDDIEMVHQIIRAEDLSIWIHDVFPRTEVTLVPFSDKKIVTFQFNARNVVLNDIEDGLPQRDCERNITISTMEDTAPEICIDENDVLVRIHVNLEQKAFMQLASILDPLAPIATQINHSLSYQSITNEPLQINQFIEWMSATMIRTTLTGYAAKLIQRRCALNMVINAATQFKQSDKSAYQVSKSLLAVLPKALTYLEMNLKEPLSLKKMAADVGTFPMLLHKAFCKLFFVTPAQYQFHHRMFKALAMAANSTASIDEIATEYGMTAKAFTAHFVSYYNCSIETLRKNQ